jgi:YD repeat-containing protein
VGAPGLPATPTRIEHFDQRGRVVRIEEIAGGGDVIATSYRVTADSRLEAILDNVGAEVARYTFCGPGDAIRITHRDSGVRTYYRDARGLIARMIAADGGQLLYTYDATGRLIGIAGQDAGAATLREYIFDADPAAPGMPFASDRLAVVRENGYTIRFAYDRAGHETSQTIEAAGLGLTSRREYNLQGDLSAVVYPVWAYEHGGSWNPHHRI